MGVQAREISKSLKFRKEPSVSKNLPYSYHLTDTVISTVNGEYLTIFKLRGRAHDCASNRDMVMWLRDLNQMIKSIGTERVKFWTHLHHHTVDDYPETSFKLKFAQHFADKYCESFKSKPMLVNDLYLTVVYEPVGDATQKMFARFDRPSREALDELQAEALQGLEEVTDQIQESFRSYGIETLGIYYRDERGLPIEAPTQRYTLEDLGIEGVDLSVDPEDAYAEQVLDDVEAEPHAAVEIPGTARAYSSALEWLSFLCNGEFEPVPVCRGRIRNYLMTTRPISSMWGDLIELRSIDEKRYTAGIEITDYDENTEAGQLNRLMEADFDFVLSQSYCCMSNSAAKGFLDRQEKALLETKDRSKSQIKGMSQAADDVASRRFIMGWHHATLHTYGHEPRVVQKQARKAMTMFGDCAVKAAPVGLASDAAFWARLPGNQALAPRPAAINSWNFLSFNSFHNFMTGKAHNNPWGDSVLLVRTTAGTPLHVNFHASHPNEDSLGKRPPGNTLILGRVGAGKTTLLNALLTASTKYLPRMYCFDKDQGMMPLITSLGGRYTVLEDGVSTGWCPAQLEPNKTNVTFVKRLLKVCVEITNNGPVSQLYVERLNAAVDHVMASGTIPHHLRDFSAISSQISNVARLSEDGALSLSELLQPWLRGNEYGWLFDNYEDQIDLKSQDIYGFDLSDFIVAKEQPAPPARTPLLMYLFFRIRGSIDGTRRTEIVLDEFAQYLDDPIMEVEIKRGLKTDRKRDCIYIFATQEANDALDSRIGKTVTQQCVTKILLENPDASWADYGPGGLNVTEAEFEAMLSIPEHSRQFLYKQGTQSTLAVMNLSGMDDVISVLSGTPNNAALLQNIINIHGNDPAVFLPKYWKEAV
ncbi:conjugal transfer protein TraB [Pseudomonas sp. Marseille-Q5115]|uniref:VirB4 family type IV secretion/conjugal transfer ATPase n=1 Tax=Pseudomonas sp. Marseille-Q5115 TaxID=2866593 RepID=UPI001CE46552|nr:conjugal transfer protein TraB [Pseudomonas sp. Marseille-Q5115]